jgi:hypothetical protein
MRSVLIRNKDRSQIKSEKFKGLLQIIAHDHLSISLLWSYYIRFKITSGSYKQTTHFYWENRV